MPKLSQIRIEGTTKFIEVSEGCPMLGLPPHWVAVGSKKPAMVFPPTNTRADWLVYAPLSGASISNGVHVLAGENVESRAFGIADGYANRQIDDPE